MLKVVLLRGCSSRVLGRPRYKTVVLGAISDSRAQGKHTAVLTAVVIQETETWLGQPKQKYCHKRDTNLS